jgi:hypothetical protein
MGQAGERPRAATTARTSQNGCTRVGGRPATAVARLGRSPLRCASLFREIVKHPGDDDRTFLSFDNSQAKPQRCDELSL